MRCVLQGKKIASREDFYAAVARGLRLPGHFGANLDALWDALTGDVRGPVEIVWRDAACSRRSMGAKAQDPLVRLLLDVAVEREDLSVTIEA
ncbi:MAG: barstar family protein [Deltaproteobacteria bacterium]|nr:barstar family protein [Deltaproteobacteria bacterium]